MRRLNELTREELIKATKDNPNFSWNGWRKPEYEGTEGFIKWSKDEGDCYVLQDNGKIRLDVGDDNDEWDGDELCPHCGEETAYVLTSKQILNQEFEIECEHCKEKIMACSMCRTVFFDDCSEMNCH